MDVVGYIVPSRPTLAFRSLRRLVQRSVIRRGRGRVMASVPSRIWGGECLLVDTQAGPMVLPTRDKSAAGLLLYGQPTHELRETRLIARIANQSLVMIDVGAHYGWYSMTMANASPDGQVVAVEPDPLTYQYLKANLAPFPKATGLAVALGAVEGSATLWRADSRDLSSTSRVVGTPISVPAWTLDKMCERRGLSPDLVKCDVEGGEIEVLKGAQRILTSDCAPIWMLEVSAQFLLEAGHADVDGDLYTMLTDLSGGGAFYSQDATGRPIKVDSFRHQQLGNNYFFVPPNRSECFAHAALHI